MKVKVEAKWMERAKVEAKRMGESEREREEAKQMGGKTVLVCSATDRVDCVRI